MECLGENWKIPHFWNIQTFQTLITTAFAGSRNPWFGPRSGFPWSLIAGAQQSGGGGRVSRPREERGLTMTRVRHSHKVTRCQDQIKYLERSRHHTVSPWPRPGREPRVSPGHWPHCPPQVVPPDLLSRLAANTEPKQNSLIVKTNFYSLLMHAFGAFTSLTLWRPEEAHQLFCDHPCFHPNPFVPWDTEKSFHSRQKKSVETLHKSQHRHYNSNGPFSFYHFSSSQKAHNWFLSTNSLFFRYVTS